MKWLQNLLIVDVLSLRGRAETVMQRMASYKESGQAQKIFSINRFIQIINSRKGWKP
jgi:hypothetical protein